jgi:hypothetical protein
MQKLIKRSSDLKDLKKEKDKIDITMFKDVAPWFTCKKVNEDLEGLEEGGLDGLEEDAIKPVAPNKHFDLVYRLLY